MQASDLQSYLNSLSRKCEALISHADAHVSQSE